MALAAGFALVLIAAGAAWWLRRPDQAVAHGTTVRLSGFQLLTADLPATLPQTVEAELTAAFSLDGVVVTAFYDDDVPATETTVDPAKPLTGSLAAGRTAKGVYVFTVPREQTSTLRIEVSSNQSATIVQFAR
jgi:hypothetical protein